MEEEDQGNDWLYVVIADIVTSHNHTIENLYSMLQGRKQLPINRLLPEEPAKISPMEATINNAIVSNFSEYVNLALSLTIAPPPTPPKWSLALLSSHPFLGYY